MNKYDRFSIMPDLFMANREMKFFAHSRHALKRDGAKTQYTRS